MAIFTETTEYSILDLGFNKLLTKISSVQDISDVPPELTNVFSSGVAPKTITAGELVEYVDAGQAGISGEGTLGSSIRLWAGASFTDRDSAPFKVDQEGNLTTTSLSASSLDIGGADATSFHVDVDGNMWLGATTFATAPFTVSNAGVMISANTSTTITGGTIQTATSGKRIVMSSNVMEFYNATPTNIASLNAGILGSGTFLYIASPSGAPFNPITLLQEGASSTAAIFIQCNDSGTGTICADFLQKSDKANLLLRSDSTSAGIVLDINNSGTASSIDISASGASGVGLNIALTNNSNADDVAVLSQGGIGRGLMINLSLPTNGNPAIEINNDSGGRGIYIHNDKTTSTERAIYIQNAGTGIGIAIELNGTGGTNPCIEMLQSSIISTNFKKMLDFTTIRIWMSDGTTPNGNLSGIVGDICLNGPSGQPFYCGGTTTWTAM